MSGLHDAVNGLAGAIAQLPGGLFVLTSTFEGRRGGVLVRYVQPCSTVPPMVMVALATGQSVEPLIRDSRAFALSQISAADRFLIRKFNGYAHSPNGTTIGHPVDHSEDPLLSLMTRNAPSGCPIIDRALCYLDCEVVRHVELEGDHRIYVGQVHRGGMLNPGTPAIRYGSTYVNGNGNGNEIGQGHGDAASQNQDGVATQRSNADLRMDHRDSGSGFGPQT